MSFFCRTTRTQPTYLFVPIPPSTFVLPTLATRLHVYRWGLISQRQTWRVLYNRHQERRPLHQPSAGTHMATTVSHYDGGTLNVLISTLGQGKARTGTNRLCTERKDSENTESERQLRPAGENCRLPHTRQKPVSSAWTHSVRATCWFCPWVQHILHTWICGSSSHT